ncbi:MAG: ExeM/NucH family extracellular endonuclease [Actinomycetota bacterium]|nr:ExeM/NucH family extracellular endonuclease [Actinomycetota bacterium]
MRRSLSLLTVLVMAFALIPTVAVADEHGECGDSYTPIYDIQGDGSSSPIVGDTIVTEGIVTVDVQKDEEHDGFFLQDPTGDGDPSTSDGVYVFNRDTFGFDVSVGDHVRIRARVNEFFGETQLGSVFSDNATVCGTGSIQPTRVKTRDFNSSPEQYEGMFLEYKGTNFVTDTFEMYRRGQIWIASDDVVEQPTNEFPGGSDAMHAMALDGIAQSVMLISAVTDRGAFPQLPFVHENGTLRIGDRVINPNGAIKYAFGNYKMVNNPDPVFDETNPRPGSPTVHGDLVVASFNVLNYWTTLGGRGADTAEQFAIQQEKVVAAIRGMGADIVGLQEMENDHPADAPIIDLIDALNEAEGEEVWARVEGFEQNIYPIVNEIIYRNDRVDPVGGAMTLIGSAFDDCRFDDCSNVNNQLGRRPVAQAFEYDGSTFTVVVNHFKSKSTTGATGADLDQGDGQSGHNARRVLQAQAVLDWIPDVVTESGDEDILVLGDFNAYTFEDPILLLETELNNLTKRYVKDSYSFNFFASFAAPFIGRGALDHAFSTPVMNKQIRDVVTWHINADEPCSVYFYDGGSSCFRTAEPDPSAVAPGPYRSSDHDPVLIGLDLDPDDHPGQGKGNGK